MRDRSPAAVNDAKRNFRMCDFPASLAQHASWAIAIALHCCQLYLMLMPGVGEHAPERARPRVSSGCSGDRMRPRVFLLASTCGSVTPGCLHWEATMQKCACAARHGRIQAFVGKVTPSSRVRSRRGPGSALLGSLLLNL